MYLECSKHDRHVQHLASLLLKIIRLSKYVIPFGMLFNICCTWINKIFNLIQTKYSVVYTICDLGISVTRSNVCVQVYYDHFVLERNISLLTDRHETIWIGYRGRSTKFRIILSFVYAHSFVTAYYIFYPSLNYRNLHWIQIGTYASIVLMQKQRGGIDKPDFNKFNK